MKKILAVSLLALAGTGAAAQSAFEGFYGQIGIGYESVKPSFSSGNMVGGDAVGEAYNISTSNGNSFTGNVGIGAYFPVTNTFLLGVGAEYSPFAGSSTNVTFSIPAFDFSDVSSWKKQNSYNVFLSPAYVVAKDKLAYAKVGYTGMSIQQTDSDGIKDTTNYTGYSLGLGYKQIVSGSIYAFGEINYAAYGSKTGNDDAGSSSKPTTMNALVGVGYKF